MISFSASIDIQPLKGNSSRNMVGSSNLYLVVSMVYKCLLALLIIENAVTWHDHSPLYTTMDYIPTVIHFVQIIVW